MVLRKSILKFLKILIIIILINSFNFLFLKSNTMLKAENLYQDIRLTQNDQMSLIPSIAVNESNIHIVWTDNKNGKYEIYYKKSTDNGLTWDSNFKLSDNYGDYQLEPKIAINGNNIHVVWESYQNGTWEIFYKKSLDNGDNWEPKIMISDDDGISSWIPKIGVKTDLIFIIWSNLINSGYSEIIFYRESIDNGDNWQQIKKMPINKEANSRCDDITINNSNIYIVCTDFRHSESNEIYIKISKDLGINWEIEKKISPLDGIDSQFSSIAVNDNNIHVVWEDIWKNKWKICYTKSIDNGKKWNNNVILSINEFNSSYPDIAIFGDYIFVIWTDDRDGSLEIYYKLSLDKGETWGSEIKISDNDEKDSQNVKIGIWQKNLHIVWEDFRNDNWEIYYKHLDLNFPYLFQENVTPNLGYFQTIFNYTINYFSIDEKPPTFIYVNINGINYTMNETNKNIIIYNNIKEYYFLKKLNKSGTHTFQFYTSNGENDTQTRLFYGPIVKSDRPAYIEIIPNFVTITINDFVQFSIKVYNDAGNILNVSVIWDVPYGGIIDQTGNFTAIAPGTWVVYANVSNISGNATIKVISNRNREKIDDGKKEEIKDNLIIFIFISILVLTIIIISLFLFKKKPNKKKIK